MMKNRHDPVQLLVAADFDQLPVMRAAAETLAVLAYFTLDEVADITLAVDEVCSQLIAAALTGTELHCSFTDSDAAMMVTISARVGHRDAVKREGFGWHVLDTLTDSLSLTMSPAAGEPAGGETTVEFVKHKTLTLPAANGPGARHRWSSNPPACHRHR